MSSVSVKSAPWPPRVAETLEGVIRTVLDEFFRIALRQTPPLIRPLIVVGADEARHCAPFIQLVIYYGARAVVD